MKAIISDVHANLEAFQAVLADIESKGVDGIICLGDVIGYGPQPVECLDLCYNFDEILLGNHEEAVLMGAVGFNPKAAAAVDWTRDQLLRNGESEATRNKRWNFLGEMKLRHEGNEGISFVHGSPREPTREYIFRSDIRDQEKMAEIFREIDRACFAGHTHTPGVFTVDGDYLSPGDCGGEWPISGKKAFINVGSVGQPRDGDIRASYVTIDEDVVRFCRVPYDVEKTIAVFGAIPELPPYLGLRLREGH